VGFFATAGAAFLPSAVAAFRREHPIVQLDLRLTEPKDPLAEVVAGRADIAITVVTAEPVAAGVRLVHLIDDPFRVVLPRGHRLVRKRVVTMSELAEEQWVDSDAVQGPCRQVVMDALACAGITPSVAVAADDYPTTQGFVAAGLGVALIPELGLGSPHPGVVVRRLRNPEPVRRIHVAVREALVGQPAADGFVRLLAAAAGRTSGGDRDR
jgi:DNA-binding transcriptional LysR family regulator